jgi:hypothetical protein
MTEQPRKDIDIISAALHGDKQTVLRAELALVRDDFAQRLGINTKQRAVIEEELRAVRQRILDVSVHAQQGARHTREELDQEKEYAKLTTELRQEDKDCWNDVQHLRDVERNLLVQLLFLDQRDQRLREFL